MHACLITLQKQTCRNLLWLCSHFVVTKNHPDDPKARPCRSQIDVPQSYARMRDFAAQDVQIVNASINSGAVNTTKRQRYRIIHREMEFGLWKFIQVDFTWLLGPFSRPTWGHFPVAWKQRCRGFVWGKSPQLASEDWMMMADPITLTLTTTHTRCTIPTSAPTFVASSGPSAARVNTARRRLNCALSRSAHVRAGVLMAAARLLAQGLI